eukprot:CAMPEP_0170228780 /NCGR_PEP_ID=MMETSP0116_2-20130129/14111_1 /TAXON_ID=400756 /ORGANISM="Durinskia baltica, Strain CSIRO CS-38" /LENGTH=371 /DNA_ID=CAMNT_0010479525 /DNA_START=46 /DNA_END=1161 /DNA_ORIENTATION=+
MAPYDESLTGGFGKVPILKEEFAASMKSVQDQVQFWDSTRMSFVKKLQEAERNHGEVVLMRDGDRLVAVKKMPKKWVRATFEEFEQKYPTATEKPWVDMAFIRQLNNLGYPYVCHFHGFFLSETEAFVVSEYCETGDLFVWCEHQSVPKAGYDRELMMVPMLAKIVSAVRWLHDLGVAHRDISLENILLTGGVGPEATLKIIDFGMATLERNVKKEVRGKASYQAPEVHTERLVDTFMLDEFAIGVVAFAMMAQDYPWQTTKRGMCQLFEFISNFGMIRFFAERRLRSGDGQVLDEVFSRDLIDFIIALTDFDTSTRASLGESCYEVDVSLDKRKNVWNLPFLSKADEIAAQRNVPVNNGSARPRKKLLSL